MRPECSDLWERELCTISYQILKVPSRRSSTCTMSTFAEVLHIKYYKYHVLVLVTVKKKSNAKDFVGDKALTNKPKSSKHSLGTSTGTEY